jgi:aspartate carbamoyltransferase regulatory subunit
MSTDQHPSQQTGSHSRVRQVEAIANGTVIDHIPAAHTLMVAGMVAHPDDQVFIGQNLRSARQGRKGVVKLTSRELTPKAIAALALVAPGATICRIQDYTVVSKLPVPVPPLFEGVARCANPNCVTNHERWTTRFAVITREPLTVRCRYCERAFPAAELAIL